MMTARGGVWTGLGALLLAVPGTAQAAGSLDCMAQSYDSNELIEIARLSKTFSFDDDARNSGDELAQIGLEATTECADKHGWSEATVYYATLFELGRLSEAAYRRSSLLTDGQLGSLDKALANGDRSELWAMMEKTVIAGLEQREPDNTPQDELLLGRFLYAAGFGDDLSGSERAGEFLGTIALQRIGRREFNALLEGE